MIDDDPSGNGNGRCDGPVIVLVGSTGSGPGYMMVVVSSIYPLIVVPAC